MTRRQKLALLSIWAATSLAAQTSAVLSGTVTDPSGAVVPNAAITVTSVDTGAVRSAVTGSAGDYQVLSLPVGEYQVRAEKTGFTPERRTGGHLAVGPTAVVDLSLRLGESSQAITVNADAPLVGTTTSDVSGVVAAQQIRDLPLNGRSYDELLTLNPGVVNFTWILRGRRSPFLSRLW